MYQIISAWLLLVNRNKQKTFLFYLLLKKWFLSSSKHIPKLTII